MPDTEVVEAPVAEAPAESEGSVAEPVSTESPEAAPEAAGDAEAQDEGTEDQLVALLADLTPAQFDALAQKLPKETLDSSTFIQEQQRRGEQRARTREQEQEEGRKAREDAYSELISHGKRAESVLDETLESLAPQFRRLEAALDPDFPDAVAAKAAMQTIRDAMPADAVRGVLAAVKAGATAEAGRLLSSEIRQHVVKHADLIGTLTEAEQAKLEKAGYEDSRKGTASLTGLLIDILVERATAKGESAGIDKGKKDKATTAELLDKIKQVQQIKNGAAPAVAGSPAVSSGPLTLEEAKTLPIEELKRRTSG